MRLYTQAEKDALADAATLRGVYNRHGYYRSLVGRAGSMGFNVWLMKPWSAAHAPEAAACCAREAARLAFRAVPALRIPDFESAEDAR